MPHFWLRMLWLEVDLALDLCKLQCVQNTLARIVTNTTKYSHITPDRKILHWLPIEHRSIFTTALLVYKFLNCGQPKSQKIAEKDATFYNLKELAEFKRTVKK